MEQDILAACHLWFEYTESIAAKINRDVEDVSMALEAMHKRGVVERRITNVGGTMWMDAKMYAHLEERTN